MPNYFTRAFTLMKRQTTIAMFGILFAAAMALGTVTVSGFSQPLFVASTDTKAISHMGLLGHFTLTATDPDGKITSYIQTDNVIVNVGENCVAESIFNVTTGGNDPCGGVGTHTGGNGVADGGFTYIAIGTGGNTPALETDQVLIAPTLNRIKDNSTVVISSTGTGALSVAKVTLDAVFTATAVTVIDESGIFDAAIDGNMLARQTFQDINLNKDDRLTVEWEVTIGTDTAEP